MKSHVSEDTDDENCDDPIRLFDTDLNAIYFGTQPHGLGTRDTESRWKFETIGNETLCQPGKETTVKSLDDLEETLHSDTISECDISPLYVKLVDCGKFPWYFRKYTQQIMHKIVLNQCSDSEHEIDVEAVEDDSDDCYIVEDLPNVKNKVTVNEQISIKTLQLTGPKPKSHKNKLINKSQETVKRRRDDRELQRALSVKNLVKVDLKRNQGLVGMKITQKMVTNCTQDVKTGIENEAKGKEKEEKKIKDAQADEKFISAADKVLSHIGTQLIPIMEETESKPICQTKVNNDKQELVVAKPTIIKSTSSQNLPVQFDISKISDKLIDNLKLKKMNDLTPEPKLNSKVPNNSLLNNPEKKLNMVNESKISCNITTAENLTNSPIKLASNVKDVKKTNKYKNDQIKEKNKASHSSLIGLLVTNKSKDDNKEKKCTKQKRNKDVTQGKVTKDDKKPRKKTEKQKREPKSPILHCTVPKKLKHQMPVHYIKSGTNIDASKELGKLEQIVDKLTNPNKSNVMQDNVRPKNVIPKNATVTKPFDVPAKQTIQVESCIKQNKTVIEGSNIQTKSLNMPPKLAKNCNDFSKTDFKTNNFHDTKMISVSQNKTSSNEQNESHETHHVNVNKHSISDVSETNPSFKPPIKKSKPAVCNSNVSSTTVTSASQSKPVPSNQYANVSTNRPHIPIHNTVPSRISSNNIPYNNINVPVQNRYASAIILKSNNHSNKHSNFSFEKHCEPPAQTMGLQKHMTIPSYIQPRYIEPQPYPMYYPSAPSAGHRSYFSSPATSAPSQFQHPNGHIGQQSSDPMQNFYRGWLPKILTPPPPPPPPPPPIIPPKNSQDLNRTLDYYPQSVSVTQNPQSASRQNAVNTQKIVNSSIIGINNDGLVKRINIVARQSRPVEVENVKNPQITLNSPIEEPEVVATKTEMLKELDKLSFVDENMKDFKRIYPARMINKNKKENTLEVAIMSQKPGRFETLKLTMNQKDSYRRSELAKGYSPPILPIPTFHKVLGQVLSNSQPQNAAPKIGIRTADPRINSRNEAKPMRKQDFVKCCKRKLNSAWNNDEDSKRKDDAKKISLEEYKKRSREKYNNRRKIEYKYRENVDYSTETDLGYDSDSTVIL